jgi:hypothetical protein
MARKPPPAAQQTRMTVAGQPVRPGAVIITPSQGPAAPSLRSLAVGSVWTRLPSARLFVVGEPMTKADCRNTGFPRSSLRLTDPRTGDAYVVHGANKGSRFFRILDDGSNK